MIVKWGSCALLVVCLALSVGCRTPQPVLKPDKVPEKLVSPPQEARYNSPGYPDQAIEKQVDPAKALMEARNSPGANTRQISGGAPGGNLSGRN